MTNKQRYEQACELAEIAKRDWHAGRITYRDLCAALERANDASRLVMDWYTGKPLPESEI